MKLVAFLVAALANAPAIAQPALTPEAAMRSLTASIFKKDREAFLSHFSRTKPHFASNYLNGVNRKPIPFTELARDIRARKGLWCEYMARCDELDADLADAVTVEKGAPKPWIRDGVTRFRSPEGGPPVSWRPEGKGWVVDEIGEWKKE